MKQFALLADRRGALWDLLLYVPTVVALASIAAKLWYGGEQVSAYGLAFLASFFFLVGANRILKTRLMLLPSAPVRLAIGPGAVTVVARDGNAVDLVKNQKVYADLAGRSFGISGLDGRGQRLLFVFHRAQFADDASYAAAQDAIRRAGNPAG